MAGPGSDPPLVSRARELIALGTPTHDAWSLAQMEDHLRRWPTEWGNELEVLIGGDFESPEADLILPALGIKVFKAKTPNDVFCGALSVVRARIAVPERSLAGYNDAIRRLNILLGSQAMASWGASGLAWWCALWGMIRSARSERLGTAADPLNRRLDSLPAGARSRVKAALYWIREPRAHLGENRPDAVRAFASYWTAFECLISAACQLVPMPPASDEAIREAIASLVGGSTSQADALRRAYRLVEPTLADRARHVFTEFLPNMADNLIEECFTASPTDRRLAAIRNSISHGGVKPEDLDALAALEPAEARLRRVVWPLLEAILQRPV